MVTETVTAMDVDYVHEYEYDEDNSQQQQQQHQQPPQEGHGPGHSATPGSVGTNDKPQITSIELGSHGDGCTCGHAGCIGVLGGSVCGHRTAAGGGEGDRIFIRAPLDDTFATDQCDDAGAATIDRGRGGGGGIEGVSCNCEAQSRYGSDHHHHPLQVSMVQFSVVMGHI
jgi:hypothetical protein